MNFPALIPVGVPGAVIRRFRVTDAAQLNRSVNESREHLRPFMPWASLPPLTIEERVAQIEEWNAKVDDFTLGIFDGNDRVLGGTGYHDRIGVGGIELGYWVHVDFLRRGIATEVARALTNVAFGFNPSMERVEIHHDRNNATSGLVAARLGFMKAGERERPPEAPGECGVLSIWRVVRSTWRNPSAGLLSSAP